MMSDICNRRAAVTVGHVSDICNRRAAVTVGHAVRYPWQWAMLSDIRDSGPRYQISVTDGLLWH